MDSTPRADSFRFLVDALNARKDQAWEKVCECYTGRLVALARSRLEPGLRVKVGSADVVQSVYRMLDLSLRAGLVRPRNWDELWGLLARMTVFRCCKWYRDMTAQKRDYRREVPADAAPEEDLFTREPPEQEVVDFLDTIKQSLAGLDEQEQKILTLGLLGFENAEISERVGCSEHEVSQFFSDISGRLEGETRKLEAAG